MKCEVIVYFVCYCLYYFTRGNNFLLRGNCTFFLFLDSARYVLSFSKSSTRLGTHLGFVLDQLEGEVDFFCCK